MLLPIWRVSLRLFGGLTCGCEVEWNTSGRVAYALVVQGLLEDWLLERKLVNDYQRRRCELLLWLGKMMT